MLRDDNMLRKTLHFSSRSEVARRRAEARTNGGPSAPALAGAAGSNGSSVSRGGDSSGCRGGRGGGNELPSSTQFQRSVLNTCYYSVLTT